MGFWNKSFLGQSSQRQEVKDASVWSNLGEARFQLKQYEQAVSALEQATRLNPDDLDSWDSLPDAYTAAGRPRDAILIFSTSFTLTHL